MHQVLAGHLGERLYQENVCSGYNAPDLSKGIEYEVHEILAQQFDLGKRGLSWDILLLLKSATMDAILAPMKLMYGRRVREEFGVSNYRSLTVCLS